MGWGLANMWYDKFGGLPPHGSLLETIFVLIHLQRQQANLLSTRALVQALVGLHESKATQDPAIQAFKEYCDKTFPFLDNAINQDKDKERKLLEEFTKRRARIHLYPIYKQQAEHAKKMATLRRFKLGFKPPGTHL